MLPNPHRACVTINYLTTPSPVMGWGISPRLPGIIHCPSRPNRDEAWRLSPSPSTLPAGPAWSRRKTTPYTTPSFVFISSFPSFPPFFGHRNTSHQSSLAFTLTLTRDLGALFPLSIMENGIGLRMEEHLRQGKTAIMTQ